MIRNINRYAIVKGLKEWEFPGFPIEESKKIADLLDTDKDVEGYDKDLLAILEEKTAKYNGTLESCIAKIWELLGNFYLEEDLVKTLAQFARVHTVRDLAWERQHNQPSGVYIHYRGSEVVGCK